MHPVPSHILCSYPVCTQCNSSSLTLGTHWAVGIGYTLQRQKCIGGMLLWVLPHLTATGHTGYIPSVTVAVSHLVHTGHRVYTLGILGTHWVYTASYYPTVYFLTLQLLSHWVLLRLTATFTLGITPPLKSN